MFHELDVISMWVSLINTWRDALARVRGLKVNRQTLLCLLCVVLSISALATLWAIMPSFKPALAQLDDNGTGNAEAQLGPGKRVRLPAIDNENGWDTWVQVQNVGTTDTGVIVFFWGNYSNKCPANDPGPINTACMTVVENGVWTLKTRIPTQAKSAIAYSVATTVFNEACEDAGDAIGDTNAWRAWEDIYEGTGEPLAVIAQRTGPNDFGIIVSSAYPGITESMQGEGPPYQYFTPYAMRRYHDLYTRMIIQNSGDQCTPVSIYYKEQGRCPFQRVQRIEQLAPGESIRLRVPDDINCEWLGSAYVQANQPLSIIVDQISFSRYCLDSDDRGTLLTYWAEPYKPAGNTLAYANLLFRMWSGWQTGIQVQNLTQESLPTFVTVDFMDNSGGELLFVGDWICPNGATTFYLPAISDLGPEYAGAADIQSHRQVDYPSGKETDGQPIFAVVDVKKALIQSDTLGWITAPPGEAQGGAYNADPLSAHRGWRTIALPLISKSDEVVSTIAIRNNSNCNKIQLQVNIYDQTGTRQTVLSNLWLRPKHLRLIDLASMGTVVSGFIGAGTVEVTGEEQLCDTNGDGYVDPELVIPSVVVLNKGQPAGDITTTYEGIPYMFEYWPCSITISGHVIDQLTLDPINDADIHTLNRVDEGPFTASGIAYIGDYCANVSLDRLAGTHVELEKWDADDTAWYTEDATTTNSDGVFEFEDFLELGETYRLTLLAQANGNSVSYESDEFDATCDVKINFRIETDGGDLDLDTGTWCEPDISGLCVKDMWQAATDSTGHYSFDYSKTTEPITITVKALHTDYTIDENSVVTRTNVACDDQVANFDLYPLVDTVWVEGWVTDKMTGLPLEGATVQASNVDSDSDTTNAAGYYSIELDFDPDCTTWVYAGAPGYNPEVDSVFIPNGETAAINFELRQTPQSRVLLYYGNGGVGASTGDPVAYNDLEDLFDGWYYVDYTDEWPTQFDWTTSYKLIVLLAPGYDSGDDLAVNGFTWGQKTELDSFLQQDGVLVVLSDATAFTGHGVENDLLEALSVDLAFNGGNYSSGHGDQSPKPDECLVQTARVYSAIDVATPPNDNWTDITSPGRTADPGVLITQNLGSSQCPGCPMYAADISPHGNGMVIILGDLHGLSDGAHMSSFNWPADNEDVARNWIFCAP